MGTLGADMELGCQVATIHTVHGLLFAFASEKHGEIAWVWRSSDQARGWPVTMCQNSYSEPQNKVQFEKSSQFVITDVISQS